jgi:hypothetical protein
LIDQLEAAREKLKPKLSLPFGPHLARLWKSDLMALTPRLARDYGSKTDKTLSRDVNALLEMKLVRRLAGRQVIACRELILAFLPWRTPIPSKAPSLPAS